MRLAARVCRDWGGRVMRGLGERFTVREWGFGGQLGIGCGRIFWTYVVSIYLTIHPKKKTYAADKRDWQK
jgi:hypothetical protein